MLDALPDPRPRPGRARSAARNVARWTVLGCVVGAPASALADPAGGTGAESPTAGRSIAIQEPCSRGRESAIAELACELANALAAAPAGALVVGAPLVTTSTARQPDELVRRVTRVLAGRLRRGTRSATEVADLTRARSLASTAGTLVYLTLTLEAGEARVDADVYPVPARFWDRVRDPRPNPVFHAFASRRMDPEIRTFLPPVPLVASHIDHADLPESHVVALGCDDVDGDGAIELVTMGRHEIVAGRIRGGILERTASQNFGDLAPIAQAPLREPVGSVAIFAGSHLDVGSSDRAYLVRLGPDLQPGEKPGRRLPWPAGGCSRLSGGFVSGAIERCTPSDPQPPIAAFGFDTDAIAGATLLDGAGRPRAIYAGRRGDTRAVELRDDAGRKAQVGDVGAQLAVADLDGNGEPELLASLDTLDPATDAVVVRTWRSDGRIEERLRIPVPEGVRAIAACPSDGLGMAPIAVATLRRLWIVR